MQAKAGTGSDAEMPPSNDDYLRSIARFLGGDPNALEATVATFGEHGDSVQDDGTTLKDRALTNLFTVMKMLRPCHKDKSKTAKA